MKVPSLAKYFFVLGEKEKKKCTAVPIAGRIAKGECWPTPTDLLGGGGGGLFIFH